MQKRFIPIAVTALMAAACGHAATEPPAENAARTVSAATMAVTRRDLAEPFESGGVIRAKTTATITARIMASVEQVPVAAGDRVHAGQLLARLDARDLGAQQRRASSAREAMAQASQAAGSERDASRAALALANAMHTRVSALHARKSATDGELDQAVAQLREAEARAAGADARVAEAAAGLASASAGADAAGINASWAIITAPFDGVVAEKFVEPGNMAAPGQPLFRLEQQGGLRLEVRIDESRATFVTLGKDVDVSIDAPGGLEGPSALTTTGRVAEMARDLGAGSHAFLVKIDLPREVVVPSGSYARARFAGPSRPTITVPATAIVRNGQLTSVFAVDGERARLRLVSLGRARGDAVEVLAGLETGDRIVARVVPGLTDGVRIGGAR